MTAARRPAGRGGSRAPGLRRVVVLLALALLAVGCTGGGGDPGPAPVAPGPVTGAGASTSLAAELQAGLSAALVERVYATAAARRAGDVGAPAAVEALDAGSQALADLLGGASDRNREPLLDALRESDRRQVADALASATGPPETAGAARAGLELAQRELAGALRQVAPALPVAELTGRFAEDLALQLSADGPAPYVVLRTLANRARDTAQVLAAAISEDQQLGPAPTRATTLRAELTGLLTEHVLLTAAFAAETAAGRPDGLLSARDALAGNRQALVGVLGVSYPVAAVSFDEAWSVHLARLQAFASSVALTGETSTEPLVRAPMDLAGTFAGIVPGLPEGRLAEELTPLVETQLRAVEAAGRRSSAAPAELRLAVAAVPSPAALLAAAMAEDLRLS